MDPQEGAPLNQISIPAEGSDKATASMATPSVLTTPASVGTSLSFRSTSSTGNHTMPSWLESQQDYHFVSTPRSYTAVWWKHFRILDPLHHPPEKKGDQYACCKWCMKKINFGKGVAGLKTHISAHEKDKEMARKMMAEKRESKRNLFTALGATTKKSPMQRKQEVLEATVCWIIEENVPLNMVEKQSFRRMCTTLDSNAPKISQPKVRDEIKHLGDICKQAVQKELCGQYFALTTDHWTSKNNETYGALTAHYIDNSQLKRCVLHFEIHHGTTTGDALFANLEGVFESYQFDLSFVTAVTTDTTGNMNTFGRRLAEHGVTHLYCIDHNLHLNAKLAFDGSNLPGSGNAMKAARSLVEYFNSSTQAVEKLCNMQKTTREGEKPLKLLQDVKTRWWSTWRMLDRLLLLTPSIDALIASGQVKATALTSYQKQVLAEVEDLLAPMAKAQKTLEGDKYPTISFVPFFVWKLRENLKARATSPDTTDAISCATKHLAQKMLMDFNNNRYGDGSTVFHHQYVLGNLQQYVSLHKIVVVATFLDPRFKTLHPFILEADKPKIFAYVLELMQEIAEGNKNKDSSNREVENYYYNQEVEGLTALVPDHDDFFAELGQRNGDVCDLLVQEDTIMLCDTELHRYKCTPQISTKRDPLKWWADNAMKFPILATLARKYLAIPATSASSERLWSIASQIITKTRTQLEGHIVADLIFLKENGHILEKHAAAIEGRQRMLPTVYESTSSEEEHQGDEE